MEIDLDVPRIRTKLKASVTTARKGGCVYIRHAEDIRFDLVVLGSMAHMDIEIHGV